MMMMILILRLALPREREKEKKREREKNKKKKKEKPRITCSYTSRNINSSNHITLSIKIPKTHTFAKTSKSLPAYLLSS